MVLRHKVALVTGAGRGIGKAVALQLARDGADIAVAGIRNNSIEQTSVAIKEVGQQSVAIQADVGNLVDIDRMVLETVQNLGGIDILVNNAGVTQHIQFLDITEGDWDRIHRVNAKGAFFCMQQVAREMIQQGRGGRIINIASIGGKGYPGTSNAAYAASKGAVISMTHIAAHQLARHDINVNAICPGEVRTEMSEATMAERAQSLGVPVAELKARQVANIPIGRLNEPGDIAAMVAFLAGPGAHNITGQAFNVDGGLVMH
jgi:NAD(P)-dependent dehydrogenase (short-subunit alcohol dehydrogenase family)